MDLYLETTKEKLSEVFTLLGFEVEESAEYVDAELKNSAGRFHAMFAKLGDRIYCDLHYDKNRHQWFIGVDYKDKPQEFFENELEKMLEERGVGFEIKRVSWFTRRNKAVFKGFRL